VSNNKKALLDEARKASTEVERKQVIEKFKRVEKGYKDKESEYLAQIEDLSGRLSAFTNLEAIGRTGVTIAPKTHGGKMSSIAFAMYSDNHIEERVDPATINGLNEYNPRIARARNTRFFQTIVELVEIERHGTNIDELILHVGGDLISGYIHEELQESNYMSPVKASKLAVELLHSGIQYLLDHGKFKRITVACNAGNHGRTTQKKRISTSIDNSFEWLLYSFLSMLFKGEKRLNFVIADGYFIYLNIFDFKARLHHGDSFKSGGGVGGITIPIKKKIAQWNKARSVDFDFFGHFHQFINHRDFTCNGSMVGYNAYAQEIAAEYERPTQGFMLINPKYGKSAIYPIIL